MSTTSGELDRYPRPGLTVDLAILTVTGAGTDPVLRLLVQDRDDPPGVALPGRFVRERATVAETAAELLRDKVGIDPPAALRPRLLRLFDDPDRDDRTWAVSAAHSLSLPERDLRGAKGDLVPVAADGSLDGVEHLAFDLEEIVAAAVEALRARYEIRYRYLDVHPDPDGFLVGPATLHQIRRVHEAVVGDDLHKDNFNRRMREQLRPVTKAGEVATSSGLRGRPATLYTPRRRG